MNDLIESRFYEWRILCPAKRANLLTSCSKTLSSQDKWPGLLHLPSSKAVTNTWAMAGHWKWCTGAPAVAADLWPLIGRPPPDAGLWLVQRSWPDLRDIARPVSRQTRRERDAGVKFGKYEEPFKPYNNFKCIRENVGTVFIKMLGYMSYQRQYQNIIGTETYLYSDCKSAHKNTHTSVLKLKLYSYKY